MNEEIINRINNAMVALLARLEADIKRVPPQELEHVAHTLMQLAGFKEELTKSADRERTSTDLLREITKSFRRTGPAISEIPRPGTDGFLPDSFLNSQIPDEDDSLNLP